MGGSRDECRSIVGSCTLHLQKADSMTWMCIESPTLAPRLCFNNMKNHLFKVIHMKKPSLTSFQPFCYLFSFLFICFFINFPNNLLLAFFLSMVFLFVGHRCANHKFRWSSIVGYAYNCHFLFIWFDFAFDWLIIVEGSFIHV